MESTLINPPQLQVQGQLGSLSSYMVPPPVRGICQGLDTGGSWTGMLYEVGSGVTPLPYSP